MSCLPWATLSTEHFIQIVFKRESICLTLLQYGHSPNTMLKLCRLEGKALSHCKKKQWTTVHNLHFMKYINDLINTWFASIMHTFFITHKKQRILHNYFTCLLHSLMKLTFFSTLREIFYIQLLAPMLCSLYYKILMKYQTISL